MTTESAGARFRRITFIVPLLLATAAWGQTASGPESQTPGDSVTQEELSAFTAAYVEVRVLQGQLDARVDETLAGSSLGRERFYEVNEIAQDSGNDSTGATEEEFAEHRELLEELVTLQNGFQDRMILAVESVDLTVDRFNEIIVAVQDDPVLTDAVRTRIEARIERR